MIKKNITNKINKLAINFSIVLKFLVGTLNGSSPSSLCWHSLYDAKKTSAPTNPQAVYFQTMGLQALESWTNSQGIYRFDQEYLEFLYETEISRRFPIDFFSKLPETSCYIETPDKIIFGRCLHGFFVQYIARHEAQPPILNLALHYRGNQLVSLPIRLTGSTMEECLEDTLNYCLELTEAFSETNEVAYLEAKLANRLYAQKLFLELAQLAAVLFFLCSENCQLGGGNDAPSRPREATSKDSHSKARQDFPKISATTPQRSFYFGATIGGARTVLPDLSPYNRASARSAHHPVTTPTVRGKIRPHQRRAHFRQIFLGPRTAVNRERKLVWIGEIGVNLKGQFNPSRLLVPTVRFVRPGRVKNRQVPQLLALAE